MSNRHTTGQKSPDCRHGVLHGRPGSGLERQPVPRSLAESNLIRLTLKGNAIVGEERLLHDLGARIRDVRVGNDGKVYVLTDEETASCCAHAPGE
jgi:glucose/arabinose dehydrogenase